MVLELFSHELDPSTMASNSSTTSIALDPISTLLNLIIINVAAQLTLKLT